MVSHSTGSDVCAPDLSNDLSPDEDLIRGLILALEAGGRKAGIPTVSRENGRIEF